MNKATDFYNTGPLTQHDVNRYTVWMQYYLDLSPDLFKIFDLVQKNQNFFGDYPAGTDILKIVLDYLEKEIEGK